MFTILRERKTMRYIFTIALKYLFSHDLEFLKLDSAPKSNVGPLEAGRGHYGRLYCALVPFLCCITRYYQVINIMKSQGAIEIGYW
jgi:hypothetical protein